MEVLIIPILDAYHIRTNFITKANYHAIIKDSQNNISEAWETSNFYKIKPPPCSKRYKWSTRAKLSSSKDISEAHRYSNKFQSSGLLPKGVYSKDDCVKLKSKD